MNGNAGFPKDYRTNMEWRTRLLHRCAKDPLFREKTRELFFRDPLFAFNAFFFTYDPRKRPYHQQPFCTYGYQDEAILSLVAAINNGEDLGIEKSRDMGATWLVIGTFVWFWLNPSGGADFLCGSRIEDYVDKKGDMRTLLEKARYIIYRLPHWLRPRGFKKNKHDNFMRLQNPETQASITGESNNANFSTGGRYAGILFDEFAKWEGTDKSAWTAAGDASPCRLAISTPFGAGGQYYELMTDGKTKKIVLHWTLHPEKRVGLYCMWPPPNALDKIALKDDWEPEVMLRSIWYDKQCERRTPTEIAQELDIDYLGAGNPVFEGRAAQALKYYRNLRVEAQSWLQVPSGEPVPKPRDTEGYLTVYRACNKGNTYIVAADVAEGKIDGDYSVVKVYNRETKDIDATFYSKIDEVSLADVIEKVAWLYSNEEAKEYPWVAVEANGPGLATFDRLLEKEVPNLFMMPKYETTQNAVTYRKGWITSGSSKKMIVAGIKEYLLNREGFIDPRCVGELGTFVRDKNGKAAAKAGCYDDEVMCFGICLQVDEIAPWVGKKERKAPHVPSIESAQIAIATREPSLWKEPSIEEQCLAQSLARQVEHRRFRQEFYEDMW